MPDFLDNERDDYIDKFSTRGMIGDMQQEIDMLHAENALKLTQILGLEQILYETRVSDMTDDKSPCWCVGWSGKHTDACNAARKATEPFWKK